MSRARLVAVTFDAAEPSASAAFWAALLERTAVEDDGGMLVAGDRTQVGLRFFPASRGPIGPARLHLHVTTTEDQGQDETVARAVSLGAHHLDVGQLPEEGHVVLADPGGAAFCVIEPGNRWLAGCGRLGEVTCDGTREVGVFWAEALGWPLVWDQDGETAVQSPQGGTKLSWGGPPVPAKQARSPHRFDLVADDVPAEVRRLVGLGATVLNDAACGSAAHAPQRVELTDPEGNELRISAAPTRPAAQP